MSRIQSKKQLLKEISVLVDDYINHCLHKKPSYEFKIEGDNEEDMKSNEPIETTPSLTNTQNISPMTHTQMLTIISPTTSQPSLTATSQTSPANSTTPAFKPAGEMTQLSQQAQATHQANNHPTHQNNECSHSHTKCADSRKTHLGESEESEDPIKMLAEMSNPHAPQFDDNEMASTKKKKVPAKVTKKQAANIEGRKEAKENIELSKKKCVGLLTNWKRCTRDRDPSLPDPDLCSFHNNPKFIGKIEKLDLKDIHEGYSDVSTPNKNNSDGDGGDAVYLFNPSSDGAVIDQTLGLKIAELPDPLKNQPIATTTTTVTEDSQESDDVQVFIRRDEDGDFVDQDANIWDVKEKKIIGKKDLMTKQKIFFQKI